jgi:ParB-like nuclease domain
MPRKASTVRLDQRPLAAGLVSTAAKAQVLTEGRRALHPMKVAWLGIDQIDETPPELNSRQTYDEASINELAVSIKEHGILQPICVRPKGERYELVFGPAGSSRAGMTLPPGCLASSHGWGVRVTPDTGRDRARSAPCGRLTLAR